MLDDYDSKPHRTEQERQNLNADGLTITIAGRYEIRGQHSLTKVAWLLRCSSRLTRLPSDTTAAALSCLFVELTTHPEVAQTLQKELDDFFEENPEPDANGLSRLKYLQACIDEALRIMPVVPSGNQRLTPPEGLKISEDLFIPGDTIVQIPTYTLHRGTVATSSEISWGPKLI